MLSRGERWQPSGAASQGAGGEREETVDGVCWVGRRDVKLRSGRWWRIMRMERCREEGRKAGLQLGSPRKHAAYWGDKGARRRDGAAPTELAP